MLHRGLRVAILTKFDTQGDFALRLKIHESRVSQILRGRRKLSEGEARRWARILKCDPAVMMPVTQNRNGG